VEYRAKALHPENQENQPLALAETCRTANSTGRCRNKIGDK
jgi:hypothetical protein